jgi:hypothetical protein
MSSRRPGVSYAVTSYKALKGSCFRRRRRRRRRRSPSLFYLLTVGVEVVYFHLITLRHTPQSVGLLSSTYTQ